MPLSEMERIGVFFIKSITYGDYSPTNRIVLPPRTDPSTDSHTGYIVAEIKKVHSWIMSHKCIN
jgi:hypothetical protein